jgi:uncharacterized protein
MGDQLGRCVIPVSDLDRAIRFYSAVLGVPVKKIQVRNNVIGLLPYGEGRMGGLLFRTDLDPVTTGSQWVRIAVEGRLDEAVSAVAPNGGRVLETRHSIGANGFEAVIVDTEGNRVFLRSK